MKQTLYKQFIDSNKLFIYFSVLDLKSRLTYINICYNRKHHVLLLSKKIIIFPLSFSIYLVSKKKSILNTLINNINNQFIYFYGKYYLRVEFIGTGYKFYVINNFLYLILGYSHLIKIKLPSSCDIHIDNNGKILSLIHSNKYILGNIFYIIKSCRKLNIYKGKGIKNILDTLKLKLGKTKNIKK